MCMLLVLRAATVALPIISVRSAPTYVPLSLKFSTRRSRGFVFAFRTLQLTDGRYQEDFIPTLQHNGTRLQIVSTKSLTRPIPLDLLSQDKGLAVAK